MCIMHGEMNAHSMSACFLEVSHDRLLRKLDVKDKLLFQTRSEIVCGI